MEKIHGEWEISVIRQIIIRSSAGVFNAEGTLAAFKEYRDKAPISAPWAGLTNAVNWEMSNATSLQRIAKMREWAFSNNCKALAIVMPSKLKKQIYRTQTDDFEDERIAYFSDLEQACAWLTAQGFEISAEEYPHHDFIARTQLL